MTQVIYYSKVTVERQTMVLTAIQYLLIILPIVLGSLAGQIGFMIGTLISSLIVIVLASLTVTKVFLFEIWSIVLIWIFGWWFYEWRVLTLTFSIMIWSISILTYKIKNSEPNKAY